MSVIRVNDVHKKFKVYYDKGNSMKEKMLFRNRNRYEDRWVLKGVSLEVEKGQAVALLGKNGCGKSTLLKLMTKIMYPDQGSIEIEGRVSSLIELGAGFHPDLSGRENIYTNASIFGLTKKEIDARLEDIIIFSELQDFIDNPVRTYSSGMYMRLAFSVAINVDADVLLIDEILAVGDTNFQTKCFEKLRELKHSGMTIVLVTHDLGTVEKFCDKAVWINEGEIQASGKAAHVVDSYLSYMNNKRMETLIAEDEARQQKEEKLEQNITDSIDEVGEQEEREEIVEGEDGGEVEPETEPETEEMDTTVNRFGYKHIEIYKAKLKNKEGKTTTVLKAGEPAEVEIHYKVHKPLDEYVFGMGFLTLDGVSIVGCNTQLDRLTIEKAEIGKIGVVRYKIKKLNLLTGIYILNVAVVDKDGVPMDFYRDYCHFNVISSDRSAGLVSLEHEWVIN